MVCVYYAVPADGDDPTLDFDPCNGATRLMP